MTRFVEVWHPEITKPGRVPESALGHWAQLGFKPAEHPEADAEPTQLPDGDPTSEWARPDLDNYAARRLGLDTTAERTKADVLAAIRAVIAAQPTSSTDNEES